MPRRFWQPWEAEALRRLYSDSRTEDLARALGMTAEQVVRKANAMGLHKSIEVIAGLARERTADLAHASRAYRFKKGCVPANKGIKRPKGWAPGRMAESQFRPGQKPHTWVPVGSFRVNDDGILEQKFNDAPGPPKARWRSYAQIVWEREHGPIPPGHIVVFRDRQRLTDPHLVTVDRLECISRRENLARNSAHRYGTEISKLHQLRGVLARAINKRAKEQK